MSGCECINDVSRGSCCALPFSPAFFTLSNLPGPLHKNLAFDSCKLQFYFPNKTVDPCVTSFRSAKRRPRPEQHHRIASLKNRYGQICSRPAPRAWVSSSGLCRRVIRQRVRIYPFLNRNWTRIPRNWGKNLARLGKTRNAPPRAAACPALRSGRTAGVRVSGRTQVSILILKLYL